jgi:hypothetical protein
LKKNTKKYSDIRIIVGLDFGVKYSGYAYCHVVNKQNLYINDVWPGAAAVGLCKTNTVLQYDDEYDKVLCWGAPALEIRPSRRNKKRCGKIIELFKLHLSDLPDNLIPKLPIDYKKAITDYLREIGMV